MNIPPLLWSSFPTDIDIKQNESLTFGPHKLNVYHAKASSGKENDQISD